jgi:hypothetical protein
LDGKKMDLVSIAFKNIGSRSATINGFPLLPGDPMLSLSCEIPSMDISKYVVAFSGVGSASVFVIKTILVESDSKDTSKKCK